MSSLDAVITAACDVLDPPTMRHADDPVAWITESLDEQLWSAQRQIVESVRDHRELSEIRVYSNTYLDNHFEILLLPGTWEYEQFETALTPEALRAALAAAVGDPQVTIELAQWSRYPAPRGEIEFPRAGIADSRGPLALWRGYVKYGTNRRFAIWARVRLSVHAARLAARSARSWRLH